MIISLSSVLFCGFSVASESKNSQDSNIGVDTHFKGGSITVVFGNMGMLQSVMLNA